ncbi:MAG TPA: polyphosphate kinase 1, partial [Burkholderiaceae bacterium]|nr:polyphosphate kinase 1 [Burkholderiaceae bacterium]
SFEPVIEFMRQAALDPQVVAIRMTLYRTGTASVLVDLLIEAARRGKEVTVVVELKARFDEEANINLAERLEQVGVQVVYGVMGLKTHAKLALVLRREEEINAKPKTAKAAKSKKAAPPVSMRLMYYAHLSTGNYHPGTAKLYTDFGMLTARPEITADIERVFMHLTSLTKVQKLTHLWLAPFSLHKKIIAAIQNEARIAATGKPARIMAKMNALVDEATINALYAASQAGVQIDLIVRGACQLRPGVPGLSENICVRAIVGRFLEHHRILYFYDGGAEHVYLSSADWMGRNLFRRIEIAWPVLDAKLKQRVIDEGLKLYLEESAEAWTLEADGKYSAPPAAA